MSRRNQIGLITVAIWAAGIGPIYILWVYHFRSGFLDAVWGFLIYLVAFFYFLALGPIGHAVAKALPTELLELENYELEIFRCPGGWKGGIYPKNPVYPKLDVSVVVAASRESLIAKAEDMIKRVA